MARTLTPGLAALATAALTAVVSAASAPATQGREARGSITRMERLSADKGWALTDSGLLVTHDGGGHWVELTSGADVDGITDAVFLSDFTVRLAGVRPGRPGALLLVETDDGGATWRERSIETSALAPGLTYTDARLHFVNPTHGWLLGRIATSSAFSLATLLRTRDGGATWERLPSPPAAGSYVFVDPRRGFMTGAPVCERLYRTLDGGSTWSEVELPLAVERGTALYDLPDFSSTSRGALAVTIRGPAPRVLRFVTGNGGATWLPSSSTALPPGDYDRPVPSALAENPARAGGPLVLVTAFSRAADGSAWTLITEGGCDDRSCRQVTRLVSDEGRDPSIGGPVDLLVRTTSRPRLDKERLRPTDKTALSLELGFDMCAAGTAAQMQTWWDHSPYANANIYFGGAARACSQRNLDADWVATVFEQGWQLIPTWVGPQAPCTPFIRRFSSEPAEARADALAEADMAAAEAAALGLGPGAPLYYDFEYYDENDSECSAAVRAFIDAWTVRIRHHGYLAGAYGNARNVTNDWLPGVIDNPPDAVWLVPWVCGRTPSCEWTPTVFGVPGLADTYWSGYRRIRQYWGPHTESYGGVTFEIDGDYANGPVADTADPPPCWEVVADDRWQGEYFASADPGGRPAMVRDDGDGPLDFDWGSGSPDERCAVPADGFSARWTRSVLFAAGTYRFTIAAGGGARLWIDETVAVDRWNEQSAHETTALVTLSEGIHAIRLDYFEERGDAAAHLSWTLLSRLVRARPDSRVRPHGDDN